MKASYILKEKSFIPTEFGVIVRPQPENYSIVDDVINAEIVNKIEEFYLHDEGEAQLYNYSNNLEQYIILNELGCMEHKQIAYHFFQNKMHEI